MCKTITLRKKIGSRDSFAIQENTARQKFIFHTITMDFKYQPLSLKEMTIRRVIADLFKKPTVLSSISDFRSGFSLPEDNCTPEHWRQTVENRLKDEILELQLPETILDLMSIICRPMGEHVMNWKKLHESYLHHSPNEDIFFDVSVLEKLRWTLAGAIDYRKTAEQLVRSNSLDVVKKYKLACLYYMEEFIPILWRNLPKESQRKFRSKAENRLRTGGLGQEFWWPYIVEGEESELHNLTEPYRWLAGGIEIHQYAFQLSVENVNKTAVEYHFRNLTYEEKEACLMSSAKSLIQQYATQDIMDKAFPKEKYSELLVFFLSVMTPNQRMRVFKDDAFGFLDVLLVWPFQDVFLTIAENIKDFAEESLDYVLYSMYNNFEIFGSYSANLFREFFLRIPSDFWINFVNRECVHGSYFDHSLYDDDKENLEIILRSLPASARKTLIFSEFSLNTFQALLSEGKQDVVEVCLGETSLSREDKDQLKEIFQVNNMKFKTREWSGLLKLLE